ncbi:MAG TPA: hypothetical protein VKZ68_08000 [Ohtaekwangia sp.]|nr:hypothetical protein [Ohtaekwangia sp.]
MEERISATIPIARSLSYIRNVRVMPIEVLDTIIWINAFLSLFAIVFLFITFRRNTTSIKWFAFGLIITWIPIPISYSLLNAGINPNYANSAFYTVAPLFYMPFFYYEIKRPALKPWFFAIAIGQVAFGFINVLFIQKETINSYSSISFNLIVIVSSLAYYYSLLQGDFRQNVVRIPVFWLITGLFIQCSGQLMMISFTSYLMNVRHDNLMLLWVFHHGLSLATEAVNMYGAFLHFRQLQSPGHSVG